MIDESVNREILSRIKVWKTVTVGGKDHYQLSLGIHRCRYSENKSACAVMGRLIWDFHYHFSSLPVREIDLVRVTLADLGFMPGESRDTIVAKALELGLELCPPDTAYCLAAVYCDQPEREKLEIAMDPTPDDYNDPCVLVLDGRHATEGFVGGYWSKRIIAEPIRYRGYLNGEDVLVFVRPRKAE